MKRRSKPLSHSCGLVAALIALAFVASRLWAQDAPVSLNLRGSWPGHPNANYSAHHCIRNGYAYLAAGGGRLFVLDIRNAAKPVFVAYCDFRGGDADQWDVEDIALSGNSALVVGSHALRIVDISDLTKPVLVGPGYGFTHGTDDTRPRGVDAVGSYAYVAWGFGGFGGTIGGYLDVIDFADPTAPRRVGRCTLSGYGESVQVVDTRTYVATWAGGFDVIDVNQPTQPVRVGRYPSPDGLSMDMQVVGDRAYVVGKRYTAGHGSVIGNYLEVIDVNNPVNPALLGLYEVPINRELFQQLEIVGGYAYLATGEGLQIIAVTDPTNPMLVSSVEGPWAWDIKFDNHLAYLTDSRGLHVVNAANPADPKIVGTYETDTSVLRVGVSGPYVYTFREDGGIKVVNVSDPAKPELTGKYQPANPSGFSDLRCVSNRVYRVGGTIDMQDVPTGFLEVIELNPTGPRLIAQSEMPWAWPSIDISGDYLFAIARVSNNPITGRFLVVDVRNPASPMVVGSYDFEPGVVFGGGKVQVVGQHAYFRDEGYWGLVIMNISNPAHPFLTGRGGYFAALGQWGVGVAGHTAYVSDASHGLYVFDVSNPANPKQIGVYTNATVEDIILWDQRALVSGWGSVQLLDVSSPSAPVLLSGYKTQDLYLGGWDIEKVGNTVYVADYGRGLTILELKTTLHLNPPVVSAATLNLSWPGGPGIKLQKTTSLSTPNWQDVSGSEGLSQIELPCTDAAAFFRLIKP